MLNSLARRIIIAGTMLVASAMTVEVHAVEGDAVEGDGAEAASAEALSDDIRLLIDISGSMKQNDPENLRIPAVNLLVNLLPPGSTAGVWTFGQKVNMLVPHKVVDERWKKTALSASGRITSSGLFTNIGAALDQASLAGQPGGAVILLTDGMVDISKNPELNVVEKNRIFDEVIPGLVESGTQIHAVALSENADSDLLQELARSTGGLFEVAHSPEDLTRVFLRMFDDAVAQDRVPMDGGLFTVDSSIEEFTLLAFRQPGETPIQLRSPANDFYLASNHADFVNWYADNGFELVTVRQPLEGEWRLFADGDTQNRVTILSDLKLRVSNLQNTLYKGDIPEIAVSFLNEGVVVSDREFLNILDVQLIVETPSGSKKAKQLADSVNGVFSSNLDVFDETGRYQIRVSVEGRTFQREMVQELEYRPLIETRYLADEKLLKVIPATRGLINDGLIIIASITDQAEKHRLLPMKLVAGSYWQASLSDFENGHYTVELHLEDPSGTSQPVDFSSEKMALTVGEVIEEEIVPEAEGQSIFDREFWTFNELIYVLVGLGNILLAGLAVWIYIVKRRQAVDSEKDPELDKLLAKHGIETEAQNESVEENSGSQVELDDDLDDEDDSGFGSGLSDIVDAWGDEPDLEETEDPSASLDDLEVPEESEFDADLEQSEDADTGENDDDQMMADVDVATDDIDQKLDNLDTENENEDQIPVLEEESQIPVDQEDEGADTGEEIDFELEDIEFDTGEQDEEIETIQSIDEEDDSIADGDVAEGDDEELDQAAIDELAKTMTLNSKQDQSNSDI